MENPFELKFDCDEHQWEDYEGTTSVWSSFLTAELCSIGCIARASSQLAAATEDWRDNTQEHKHHMIEIYLLSSMEKSHFWLHLALNKDALRVMITAGWRILITGKTLFLTLISTITIK